MLSRHFTFQIDRPRPRFGPSRRSRIFEAARSTTYACRGLDDWFAATIVIRPSFATDPSAVQLVLLQGEEERKKPSFLSLSPSHFHPGAGKERGGGNHWPFSVCVLHLSLSLLGEACVAVHTYIPDGEEPSEHTRDGKEKGRHVLLRSYFPSSGPYEHTYEGESEAVSDKHEKRRKERTNEGTDGWANGSSTCSMFGLSCSRDQHTLARSQCQPGVTFSCCCCTRPTAVAAAARIWSIQETEAFLCLHLSSETHPRAQHSLLSEYIHRGRK